MHIVIGHEIHIHGIHGMSATDYPAMLADIESGLLKPERLIGSTITLEETPRALMTMDGHPRAGITIIRP